MAREALPVNRIPRLDEASLDASRNGTDAAGGAESEQPAASATVSSASPEPDPLKNSDSRRRSVTLEVVGRSKVRAEPSAASEIIAELEPGERVTLLARTRDYYHVRSVDDRTIRGYVHREDAFFQNSRAR
jgi:hypothetical protein